MSRRNDPDRRNRIIDAAIDCIATNGVAGTSHRKVAAIADVPLGSMTYHFTDMDELLREAFTRFASTISELFDARLDQAHDADEAEAAVVDLIHGDLQRSRREHVVTYELYTLAARTPSFRAITRHWMHASRAALEHHFAPDVARALDAYIEGAALHIALDPKPQPRRLTTAAVHALSTSLQRRQ